MCGSASIDELADRAAAARPPASRSTLDLLARVPDRVRAEQPLFDATGAVHAAAAFDRDGEAVVVREDVGRHNAVDKVVGRLLLDGALPAHDLGLYVSGRAVRDRAEGVGRRLRRGRRRQRADRAWPSTRPRARRHHARADSPGTGA